jgi:NAD(P)-dependent dehydrogenase (short-subunit alcohol dehydrogenase family)
MAGAGRRHRKARLASFASAKAALRNLAQTIAREYGPQNIHVGHVVVDGGIAGDRLLSRELLTPAVRPRAT